MDADQEQRLELKRDFVEFLDSDFGAQTGRGKYVEAIGDIMKHYPTTKRVRLEVDMQGGSGAGGRGGGSGGAGSDPGPPGCSALPPLACLRLSPSWAAAPSLCAWPGRAPPSADLQGYSEELHRRVLASPAECLPPFEEALEEFIRNQHQKVRRGTWLPSFPCFRGQASVPGGTHLLLGPWPNVELLGGTTG